MTKTVLFTAEGQTPVPFTIWVPDGPDQEKRLRTAAWITMFLHCRGENT